jgi:hypothetical protein
LKTLTRTTPYTGGNEKSSVRKDEHNGRIKGKKGAEKEEFEQIAKENTQIFTSQNPTLGGKKKIYNNSMIL